MSEQGAIDSDFDDAEMVSTVETLTSGNRWTLQADTPSARPVGDTEAADD